MYWCTLHTTVPVSHVLWENELLPPALELTVTANYCKVFLGNHIFPMINYLRSDLSTSIQEARKFQCLYGFRFNEFDNSFIGFSVVLQPN